MDTDQPFLPEPEPQAPPARERGRARRVLILWLMLIVMFVVIWQFLNDEGAGSNHRLSPTVDNREPTFWVASGPAFLTVFLLCVGFFWFVRRYGNVGRFNLSQEPARLAMAEGRFSEAATLFRDVEKAVVRKPLLRAVAQLNLGEALLWSGQTREALDWFTQLERNRLVLFSGVTRLSACANLSMVYALLGDLASSQLWLAEARRRLAKTIDDRLATGAKLCWVQAILLCRQGQYVEAGEVLSQNHAALIGTYSLRYMRSINLLRIYAASEAGQTYDEAARQSPLRVDRLAVEQSAQLMAPWSEVQAFLKRCPTEIQ